MKIEFLFNETVETRDAYLSRMSVILDSILNGVLLENGENLKEELFEEEKLQIRKAIYEVALPEIEKVAKAERTKGYLGSLEDDFEQELMSEIFDKLYRFNNPRFRGKSSCNYTLGTFIKNYVDHAKREVFRTKKGDSLYVEKMRRQMTTTRRKAALEFGKEESDVTPEEIFLLMPELYSKPLSLNVIRNNMSLLQDVLPITEVPDAKEEGFEEEVVLSDERIQMEFMIMLSKQSPVQIYILLQNFAFCSKEYSDFHTKDLAADERFISLYQMSTGKKKRPSDKDIRNTRYLMLNKVKAFVAEWELDEDDVISNLCPVMEKLREEMQQVYYI